MKRLYALIMFFVLMLSGCSGGTSAELEAMQGQVDFLNSQISDLQAELSLVRDAFGESQANLVEVSEQARELAEANVVLEEEVVTLTAQNNELEQFLNQPPTVLGTAQTVVELLADEDFSALESYIHPSAGVRFTPYTYVDTGSDIVMSGTLVAGFATDATVYNWGSYDGSGDPIDGTPMDYFAEFVYDEDYAAPEMIGWNNTISSGNMINNLADAYPAADYVEFYFSGFDAQYGGMDWSSLTLVFEQVGSDWYLVGIIHSEWTI